MTYYSLLSNPKLKLFTLLILLIFSTSTAFAQLASQTIRGTVIDKVSQIPLPKATITLLGTEPLIGATTDEKGRFMVENVPIGRYDISVSYVGYSTFIQTSVFVKTAEETLVEIALTEQTADVDEIVVTSDQRQVTNEAGIVSAKSFKVEELSSIPGSLDDPGRMLQKFAGIAPYPSISRNFINIRGNAARAVRWRLDDMDIYNPNHYGLLGNSGGSLTIFSPRLLTNSDFYSGAFPADYGNALGGVFDMRFRNGNTEKHQHSVQLGFLGLDVASEGPFSNNGNASYIANYRFSTTGLLEPFLNIGGIPVYQDLSFKLHFKTKNNGSLNIFGIGGASRTSFMPSSDTTEWVDNSSNFWRVTETITGTIGVNYIQPISDKTFFKSILIGTGIQSSDVRYYQNYDLVTKDTVRLGFDKDFKFSWQGYVNHRFSKRHTHRSGVILHHLRSDVQFLQGDQLGNGRGTTNLTDTLRTGQGSSFLAQAYSRSQFYLGERWQVNAGIHAMYFMLTGEISVEPRLSIRYQVNSASSLNFGYGLHSQMEPFFAYISERYDENIGSRIRPNEDLLFNKAHHFVLGYYNQLSDKWRLGVEAYYQSQFNLVVGENLPISRVGGYDFAFESFDLDNDGIGQNYGLEVSIEKGFGNGYLFLANTSIFESNYTANDGVARPSQSNANYIVNVVGGKEWRVGERKGKTNFLSLNLSTTYSGAQYFTNLDLQQSIAQGFAIPDYANPNTGVQDPLLLVDIAFIFKRNREKSNSQLTLQLVNILNREPVAGAIFDRENGEQDEFLGSGFLPILSYRMSF